MINEDIDIIIASTEESMQKAIQHFEVELSRIRAGKASTAMLDGVMIEYYGSMTPIAQVANITILDAKTISIQPWEKNCLALIDRAIMQANIGVTPQNDGHLIRLFLPPLTEERRKELFKKATNEGEQAKIAVRNHRRDGIEQVKKMQKDGLSEDAAKDAENSIQEITNRHINQVEKLLAQKEKDIMSV